MNQDIQPFSFQRDTFAFANELVWEYRFSEDGTRTSFARRTPRPGYTHRCFSLARAVRQFHAHARFDPADPGVPDEATLHEKVRRVLSRNPREVTAPEARIVFPAIPGLRSLSLSHEALLKHHLGGAWRSYVLRSHWRMVFPIPRPHQERTAEDLMLRLERGRLAVLHLVRFPQLTINHAVTVFSYREEGAVVDFEAYDPNETEHPQLLRFNRTTRTFEMGRNRYWAGGTLDVIQIDRTWWL